MLRERMSLRDAYQLTKLARPSINPNDGFKQALMQASLSCWQLSHIGGAQLALALRSWSSSSSQTERQASLSR